MSNPLISVIIPVYQAEKTIERCINSILYTKQNIEVICVDDGSRDNSLSILQQAAANDARLKVFSQKNAGAGCARNKGLEHAQGEYIMFCDADDAFREDAVDFIVEDIERFSPDYIVFHRLSNRLDGSVRLWGGSREGVTLLDCDWREYLNTIMIQKGHCGVVCNKVYRNDIIKRYNVAFPHFKFSEDQWFNVTYLMHCSSFVEDFRAYLIQYHTVGSICRSSYANFLDLNLEWIEEFRKQYQDEASMIEMFISRLEYTSVYLALGRIIDGTDPKHQSKRKDCMAIFNREDVRKMIALFMQIGNPTAVQKRNCELILNKSYYKYAYYNHYRAIIDGFVAKRFLDRCVKRLKKLLKGVAR